jgi:hypothetical protein
MHKPTRRVRNIGLVVLATTAQLPAQASQVQVLPHVPTIR